MGRVEVRVFMGLMLALLSLANVVAAETAAQNLSAALDEQDAWLATSTEGAAWHRFLMTEALREELARGDDAGRRRVAHVLGRYDTAVPGLQHAKFQATRRQLTGWANELRIPMALRWAARVRGAALYHAPISADQVATAKAELSAALDKLEDRFSRTSPENAQAWKSFLKWDDLRQELEADAPDWSQLNTVAIQFYDGHPGLELPEFVQARNSLRKYLFLGSLAKESAEVAHKSIVAQLDSLAKALEAYNDQPSVKAAANVGALLDWLDQLGRVPNLAADIRRYHRHPNLLLQVSEEFISRRFSDTFEETRPVNEMILRTHVRGTAHTNGEISADVVPSRDSARIDILLNGITNTRSVGRQKPVTIHSQSRTTIAARKPLFILPKSVTSLPAEADCDTYTTISSIVPDSRFAAQLIERVAWKRASQQKPLAQQIASGRAERRVERQFDERATELLGQARETLQEKLRGPLDRRGLIPDSVSTSSTDTHVVMQATQANQAQFASVNPPPEFADQQAVVGLIHESLVNNTAEQAIAGLRLSDERIAELMEELTGEVPEELQLSEDKAPWSISFDWQQPVTVEFDDQTMKLAVRGRSFTNGDNTLNEVMEMAATYSMATSPSGVVLTRQGDIEVNFPSLAEGQRPSNRQIFFRTLMRTKFEALFKAEIRGEGVELPEKWRTTLRLAELSTRDGWLSLGWKFNGP